MCTFTVAIAVSFTSVSGEQAARIRVLPPAAWPRCYSEEAAPPEIPAASRWPGTAHAQGPEEGGGSRYWTVDVLYDGEGVMYLDRGWEQFARAHSLEQGHFLNFEFNGEDTLTVKVFDGTTCHRHYNVKSSDEDEWSSTDDEWSDA